MNSSSIQSLVPLLLVATLLGCSESTEETVTLSDAKSSLEEKPLDKLVTHQSANAIQGKPVIYQVFTRLFGNKNTTNKTWGTKEENGVGKFNDFTDEALKGIKEFGTTHVWYTGVPHHAVISDYTEFGISADDPDVVKGRAGSPYAVKDYYNVNPDLAVNPANRLQEFKQLIERTHQHGMKVMIDIVPNHIARNYQSASAPEGVSNFGTRDDTSVEYKRDNNFYYVVGEAFKVPNAENDYKPLGGDSNPLSDGKFDENPAKWTGNGSRKAQPHSNDWYETVKINYGVKPDGSYDFPKLPKEYANQSHQVHYTFWKNKDVPDSWVKFKQIALYWTKFGVDGFRYDMAEMVPVEFWSYLNSSIKNVNPNATLLAEVYNPSLYRDYLNIGKMDYLYDKVDFYDTLKAIMQGKAPTSSLLPIVQRFQDIDASLLHFLENHDEQRIASTEFAGDANKGKPAMVVSSLIGKGPNLLYYAQALGESAMDDAGFGDPTRTSIFDYWGVPSLQRWMNGGKFDGGKLTLQEKSLREFYVSLLSVSASSNAFNSNYADLHQLNLSNDGYDESVYSFARWEKNEKIIVVSNFSPTETKQFNLSVDKGLIGLWSLTDGTFTLNDLLSRDSKFKGSLMVKEGVGSVELSLEPLESRVFHLK
ncbi:MAG: alpha-amylase [Kangiellaceae bacterium]|nr:alpha-amylase [Kangiellaceae bacterium]